ncbi:MAG: hypothetical protein EOO43_00660 [Flavobacterium sp.]|nr:MAG: hypothetical protein EOO43_00660 [Flavobacterium sp.]
MAGYTHIAKFYGIPCYFNENTMDVKGTNKFYDFLIDARLLVEDHFPSDSGFRIELIKNI